MKNWTMNAGDILQVEAHRAKNNARQLHVGAQNVFDDAKATVGRLNDAKQTAAIIADIESTQATLYKAAALLEVARTRLQCSEHEMQLEAVDITTRWKNL